MNKEIIQKAIEDIEGNTIARDEDIAVLIRVAKEILARNLIESASMDEIRNIILNCEGIAYVPKHMKWVDKMVHALLGKVGTKAGAFGRITVKVKDFILMDMDVWTFVLKYLLNTGLGLPSKEMKIFVDGKEVFKPAAMTDET